MEYFYGDMGEVEKEIRTIRISPSEVQTYVTEYEYDSWNRIQTMTYPDGERLYFGYNIAGNLTSLMGIKSSPDPSEGGGYSAGSISGSSPSGTGEYSYIAQQGYDEFEQKIYRRLGNDTETTYAYDSVMRRLSSLEAIKPPHPQGDGGIPPSGVRGILFQNNKYSYDLVGNILSVENAISQQPSAISSLGGSSKYAYEYDELNRLIKAKGTFEGTSNKADYELNMQYNRLNGIVQKALQYRLNGQDKGYTLDYKYDNKNHPHAPSLIANSQSPKARGYQYDGNGNPTYYDEFKGFRSMVWDEENRLRGINDNGRLHLYTYDHTGERALKSSAESSLAVINGLASAVITHTEDYTAYVSPYFVVNKGKFTKHYFEGTTRIVSKLGEGTFSHKNTGIMAGGLDYLRQTAEQQRIRDEYIKGLQVPPGPPTQHGIYTTPEWTGEAYPSVDWSEVSQNQEPPEGWPRPPKFNEPSDVPGPPVQFGEAITNANVKAGYGYIDNGVEEKNLYFYHPDHLGSSSYITDREGQIIQHTEYIAFGETFVDEHSVNPRQPYLFNGKELDYETGLYYYGARYYDPRVSLWLNTDPLAEKYPEVSPYTYTLNNPIMLIDPDGRDPITALVEALSSFALSAGVDFLTNWLIEGNNINTAFKNVAWGSAVLDAGITYGMSSFINGSGSATTFAKIAKTKAGKITISITQNFINNIVSGFETGDIKSFSDIDIEGEFIEAIFTTLLDNGFGKKADELLDYVGQSNKNLQSKLGKLKRNMDKGKGEARIKSDTTKVNIARKNRNNDVKNYIKEATKKETKKSVIKETTKAIISNEKDSNN